MNKKYILRMLIRYFNGSLSWNITFYAYICLNMKLFLSYNAKRNDTSIDDLVQYHYISWTCWTKEYLQKTFYAGKRTKKGIDIILFKRFMNVE